MNAFIILSSIVLLLLSYIYGYIYILVSEMIFKRINVWRKNPDKIGQSFTLKKIFYYFHLTIIIRILN